MFYCPASDSMIDIPAVLNASSEEELWALSSLRDIERNPEETSTEEMEICVPQRDCISAMQYHKGIGIKEDFEEIAVSHGGTMFALAGNVERLSDGSFALRVTETCCMEGNVEEMISTPFKGKITKIIFDKDV